MTKSKNFWKRLSSTLWFVPTLFVVCGILGGIIFVWIDYTFESPFKLLPSFFGVQPSGARDILAVIAGSTITVAGTVFSITIVALTLASTQFSPRILRNFMRDSGNQAVLGALVGIFAFCIVVLRTVRDTGDPNTEFIPALSVFVAVILGFVGIGCLIYFIHHVATSIQATSIISQIAWETSKEIKRTFKSSESENQLDAHTKKLITERTSVVIPAKYTGYVQNVDTEELLKLAVQYDVVLRLKRRIGQFSIEGMPIIEIYSEDEIFEISPDLIEIMQETYDINDFRTIEGDVAFGLRQIVDIALKALSPAINDTTTAVTCVDYLTSILVCLAKRPSCHSHLFSKGKLRIISEHQRFEDFFDLAFNQIRQNAKGNVAILLRQLNSINILSSINKDLPFKAERSERQELLVNQAEMLHEIAQKSIKAEADLAVVTKYYERIEKSLAERLK